MKAVLALLSLLALGLTIVPAWMRYRGDAISDSQLNWLMLLGTILWFAAATPLARLREKQRRQP